MSAPSAPGAALSPNRRDGRFLGISLVVGGLATPVGALLALIAPVGLFLLAMIVMGENTDGGIGDEPISPVVTVIVIVVAVLALLLLVGGFAMDVVTLILASIRALTRPDDRIVPILALLVTLGAMAGPIVLIVSLLSVPDGAPESAAQIAGTIGTGGIVASVALRVVQVILGAIRLLAGGRRG